MIISFLRTRDAAPFRSAMALGLIAGVFDDVIAAATKVCYR